MSIKSFIILLLKVNAVHFGQSFSVFKHILPKPHWTILSHSIMINIFLPWCKTCLGKHSILKTKSNFTLLMYIPFLGIG